jgi:nicotinic acid mononucleotide adenylyltransferase
MENHCIEGLRDFHDECLPIFSRDVLAKIRKGDSTWENLVPPQVASLIKERRLFGWKG